MDRFLGSRMLALAGCLAAGWPAAAQVSDDPLPCRVQVIRPQLDFEFRYFSGYYIRIPALRLAGPKRRFGMRALVDPIDQPGETKVYERAFEAGPLNGKRGEWIELSGSFVTGEGRYQITWIFVDSRGDSCTARWEIEAKRTRKEQEVRLSIEPGEVDDARVSAFRRERAEVGGEGRPLRLKVFLNLDVRRRRHRTRVGLWELLPRLAALRALSRDPRLAEFSLVVYNVEEQQVLTRHDLEAGFDFPSLRGAFEKLDPAFVSIDTLGRGKQRDFFARMLFNELPGEQAVDAYVFVGPDFLVRDNIERETLESLGGLGAPAFFLEHGQSRWKGLVRKTVSHFDGERISFVTPRELSEGVETLVERIDLRVGERAGH